MPPNIQEPMWKVHMYISLNISSLGDGQYEPAKSGLDSHRSSCESANQQHQVLMRTPN